MRAETGVDEGELSGLRIVQGELAVGTPDGKDPGRGMIRTFPAEGRIRRPPHARGEPDPALLVEHRIVRARLAVPDRLRSPIRGRRHRVVLRRRRLRIADRHSHFARRMPHRIQDRHEIRALLGRSVNQSVGVDRGIALVARNLIVEISRGTRPVPQADDDVALQALRPFGPRGGQLARGDPIGPVGELPQHARRIEPSDVVRHVGHRLAGRDAPRPGLDRGIEMAELLRNGTRRLVAELVAGVAAVGLREVEPLALTACFPYREFALLRNLEHRIPVDRRIIFRRGGCARRDHRVEVDDFSGDGLDLEGIDQPVAAHPHLVAGFRKLGNQVAAAIVGDHDLREFRGKVGRFGDHPYAGLWAVRARDHPAQLVCARARCGAAALRRALLAGGQKRADKDRGQTRSCFHVSSSRKRRPAPDFTPDPPTENQAPGFAIVA